MPIRLFSVLILAAIGWLASAVPLQAADAPADRNSLVRYLPENALGTIEVSNLAPLIERIETSPALKAYLASPLYDDVLKTEQARKALAGKAIMEAQLGMDLWAFAKTYLGDQLVLGVYPPANGGEPDSVTIIQVKDATDLTKLVDKLTPVIALLGDQVVMSDGDAGGKVFKFKDGTQANLQNRWIVASKNNDLLMQTLKNVTSSKEGGLASSAAWKAMAAQMGPRHTVQFCANLAKISELQGKRIVPEKLDNPVVSLLYGGLIELAAQSPYLGATLDIEGDSYSVKWAVGGNAAKLDDAHRALVLDAAQPLVPLVPDVTGRLGTISISRNFTKWYKSREQLLEAKLQPEFDKFETGLATFLPGKDFAEDVLPLLTGRIAFVAAPQDYAYLDGKPGVQIPAFGLVIELAKPREGADILNLVAQTILTISNLEASKQKRQPWVQSSESFQGVQVNFAQYLERPKGNQLATSYNFQPASALVGNRFIMSSSLGLCRQLVQALSQENSGTARKTETQKGVPNFIQELSPSVAADLVEANAAVIHAKNVQNGKTAEQSAREVEGLCTLLRHLTTIHLNTIQYDDHMAIELHGGWK